MPPSVFMLFRSPEGRRHGLRLAGAVIVVALGSSFVAEGWARLLSVYGYEIPERVTSAFARLEPGSWRTFALVAVVGPFVEELLFRAGMQRVLLWFYRPTSAVAAGAMVFAAAHLNWMQLGPALWMGLVTGVIFARTGSFSLCFLWHATYNAQFVLPLSGISSGGQLPDGFAFTPSQVAGLGARGALLVVGILLLWRALNALPAYLRPAWVNKRMPAVEPAGPLGAAQ